MTFPGGHGGFASGARSEARARFRRSHAVGQRVRGVLLSWERPGLAWVNLQGCDLLAAVEGDVQPGQPLFFKIQQLTPDIVLQQLAESGAALAGGSPLAAAHAWLAARSSLDPHLASLLQDLMPIPAPEERKRNFFQDLAGEPSLLPAWAGFLRETARVNEHLAALGGASLAYAPWLLPAARDMEILHVPADPGQRESLAETVCSLNLADLGRVELRFLGRGPDLRFRVFLERQDQASTVRQALASGLAPGLAPAASGPDLAKAFLGAAQLMPGHASPLLAFMERGRTARSGVLDTRV